MSNAYSALAGGNTSFAGVDQGIDFTGAGPIYALGEGKITRNLPSGSGWPGRGAVLNYVITKGADAGKYVYVAEDFIAKTGLKVGSTIHVGDVIGQATGEGAAPGIEVGWAQPSGIPVAPRPAARPADQTTQAGQDFSTFVQSRSGGGSSAPGGFTGFAEKYLPFGGLLDPASPGQVVQNVTGVPVVSVGKFLGQLADPNLWIRVLEIVGGSVIALAGVYLLVKEVGLAPGTTLDTLRSTPAETMAQEAERVSSEGFRKGFVQGQREAGRSAGRKAGKAVVV